MKGVGIQIYMFPIESCCGADSEAFIFVVWGALRTNCGDLGLDGCCGFDSSPSDGFDDD